MVTVIRHKKTLIHCQRPKQTSLLLERVLQADLGRGVGSAHGRLDSISLGRGGREQHGGGEGGHGGQGGLLLRDGLQSKEERNECVSLGGGLAGGPALYRVEMAGCSVLAESGPRWTPRRAYTDRDRPKLTIRASDAPEGPTGTIQTGKQADFPSRSNFRENHLPWPGRASARRTRRWSERWKSSGRRTW